MDAFSIINRANQLNPNNIAYWSSRALAKPAIVSTITVGNTASVLSTCLGAASIVGMGWQAYSAYRWYQSYQANRTGNSEQ